MKIFEAGTPFILLTTIRVKAI